ncbi:hypothetical protein GH741_01070 [Aquibacillus halophilus]|uniref:Acyltransferase n=1 Tax=Aquibacillus halophilus TaxID=930132 RepID=A0A6A8DBW3_9BACI|nr:acyltransferase [Aquibacillus halophilus]MRH41261.1 hypothetical protein [Aquibacillus halophilus]
MGKIKHFVRTLKRDLIINKIASSYVVPTVIRHIIYKWYGIKTKTKNISPGCFFGGNNISIGENSFINYNCFFDNAGKIEIEKNCSIAMDVLFCTSSHEMGNSDKRAGKGVGQPIKLGQGCWVGARATILPGVTIGHGCIIAAGSVVNKDCEPNGIYAGVPAKRIKEIE